MNLDNLRDRLDEYADGLLDETTRRSIEAALQEDATLRAELDSVRRFKRLLEELAPAGAEVGRIVGRLRLARRRRNLVRSVAAAAVLLIGLAIWMRSTPAEGPDLAPYLAAWRTFGNRLGRIALQRRTGRVPRIGVGDLEPPPARASGIVFLAALKPLGIHLKDPVRHAVRREVSEHFLTLRTLGAGVEGQWRRSQASLQLYRRLRASAGREVADAFYDVFRPGLADLTTARRLAGDLAPVAGRAYWERYRDALALLARRYGERKVETVLRHLAPADQRSYLRDASQDGVGPDAVLSIRARMYRAAAESGATKLYIAAS